MRLAARTALALGAGALDARLALPPQIDEPAQPSPRPPAKPFPRRSDGPGRP